MPCDPLCVRARVRTDAASVACTARASNRVFICGRPVGHLLRVVLYLRPSAAPAGRSVLRRLRTAITPCRRNEVSLAYSSTRRTSRSAPSCPCALQMGRIKISSELKDKRIRQAIAARPHTPLLSRHVLLSPAGFTRSGWGLQISYLGGVYAFCFALRAPSILIQSFLIKQCACTSRIAR